MNKFFENSKNEMNRFYAYRKQKKATIGYALGYLYLGTKTVIISLRFYGVRVTARILKNRFLTLLYRMNSDERLKYRLKKIVEKHKPDYIVILKTIKVEWNCALYQRCHHVALHMAKKKILYFFCTPNYRDGVFGFKEISPYCILTDRNDLVDELQGVKKVIHLYSTDIQTKYEYVEKQLKENNLVLYEYVDELDDAITGTIPEYTREKHLKILKNEKCIVVATADRLFSEVKEHRRNNCLLVTNGVENDHFKMKSGVRTPKPIRKIAQGRSPMIGYYGALASWVDFELIAKLARARPQYKIVLIGQIYDESFLSAKLDLIGNVHFLGPVKYRKLPEYGRAFDVAMIPFKVNAVTASTSPLKLFEYMALGKPVVTTSLHECKKYKTVLIAENHDDFIKKVDEALTLVGNKEFIEEQKEVAQQNSWEEKTARIIDIMGSNWRRNEMH